MVIDFHTHCFPQAIAQKTIEKLAAASAVRQPLHNGTPESLLAAADEMGVDACVVLNIATNPKQEHNVNSFAIETDRLFDRLFCFGSVHPDSPNILSELERLKAAGIKGVKLHPEYQGFFVNEKRLFPLYEKIAEMGFITVFHAGVDIGIPDPVHCSPKMLREALPAFGGAPVVAAHFGGFLCWREVLECLPDEPVMLDTAFSHGKIPPKWAKELISAFGADRVLLGSDLPWSRTDDEAFMLSSLGFSTAEVEKMLGGNAQRLLKI